MPHRFPTFPSICTRPDISFAVMTLSQWNSKPQPCHFVAAKHILRYLKGTKGLHLKYRGTNDLPLHGFTDSDWGGDTSTRASVSCYCWFFAGGLVSWSAKKQICIALSTREAEYVAMTRRAFQEGIWLKSNFLLNKLRPKGDNTKCNDLVQIMRVKY